MITQKNQSKINFISIFIGSILFFYLSYALLNIINIAILQIITFLFLSYIFVDLIYKLFPNYLYKIIDNEIIFIREFSYRYFDDYKIKLSDIESISKGNKKTLKFFNEFYNINRENEIYTINTERISIKFDPSETFIKALNERLKRMEN